MGQEFVYRAAIKLSAEQFLTRCVSDALLRPRAEMGKGVFVTDAASLLQDEEAHCK
jgi:hypothetical protein